MRQGGIIITDELNHKARRVPETETEGMVWFALSAPYCREFKAQAMLDEQGIENFIPMRYSLKEVRGQKKRLLEPVIHNLIFAHCTRDTMKRVKGKANNYLQYKTIREGGRNLPIVVPDKQMEAFIKVCSTFDDGLKFFRPGEINLAKGTKVRIIGGEFNGVEGVFVKIAGLRDRRVVVEIPLVASVATAIICADFLEIAAPDPR